MIRACFLLLVLWSATTLSRNFSAHERSFGERGNGTRHIQFSREASGVGDTELRVTPREERRIEHFLEAVFPVRQMRRYAWLGGRPPEYLPVSRRVSYVVISQQGFRFVLVGYRAEWKSGESDAEVNDLAIYRMEPSGPNQVWRSRPWQASYSALHVWTAKSSWRNVVLIQDGGENDAFGLASVFTFFNEPKGLLIRDLTPTFPWLRAGERFPFRTIYGQDISLHHSDGDDLFLSASDEPYLQGKRVPIRQSRSWKFNKSRGTFDLSMFGSTRLSSSEFK